MEGENIIDCLLKSCIFIELDVLLITGRNLYRKNLPELTRLPVGV
jgi:hypothetical protein